MSFDQAKEDIRFGCPRINFHGHRSNMFLPRGTWIQNNVRLASKQCDDVASTSLPCHFNVMCPLGRLPIHNLVVLTLMNILFDQTWQITYLGGAKDWPYFHDQHASITRQMYGKWWCYEECRLETAHSFLLYILFINIHVHLFNFSSFSETRKFSLKNEMNLLDWFQSMLWRHQLEHIFFFKYFYIFP